MRKAECVILFSGFKYNVMGKVVYKSNLDPLVRARSDTRSYDFCFTTDTKRVGFWGSHNHVMNVYSHDAFPYWHYLPFTDPRLLGVVPPMDSMGPDLLCYERFYSRLEKEFEDVGEFTHPGEGNWEARRVLDTGGTRGVIANEFDPKKGLLPVSLKATVELTAKKQTDLHYHHVIDWVKDRGLWLPKSASQSQPGKLERPFTTNYEWLEVNQPMDDAMFAYTAIQIPAITKTVDHSIPGEPPTVIADLSPPEPTPDSVARPGATLRRSIVAALIVLPLIVYYLVRHFRRRP